MCKIKEMQSLTKRISKHEKKLKSTIDISEILIQNLKLSRWIVGARYLNCILLWGSLVDEECLSSLKVECPNGECKYESENNDEHEKN